MEVTLILIQTYIIACVNVIAHFVIDGWNNELPITQLIENFYLSSYSADVYQYWWWSTLVSGTPYIMLFLHHAWQSLVTHRPNILLLFLAASWYAFGPALGRRITVMFKRFGYFDHQDRYRLKSMDIIKVLS